MHTSKRKARLGRCETMQDPEGLRDAAEQGALPGLLHARGALSALQRQARCGISKRRKGMRGVQGGTIGKG